MVEGVGVHPLACWDCGFEFSWQHGYPSVVFIAYCQVNVSALGWSLVQRSPTEISVSGCHRETSIMKWPWCTRVCCVMEKKNSGLIDVGRPVALVQVVIQF